MRMVTDSCLREFNVRSEFDCFQGEKIMKIGYAGILLGAAALLLVLIRFWVGPFTTVSSIDISGRAKGCSDT